MFEKSHPAGDGGILDVHIEHGEKDGDAPAFATHEIGFGGEINRVYLAVPGGDHQLGPGGRCRVRVAEKIVGKGGEQRPQGNDHPRQRHDDGADFGGKPRHREQYQQGNGRQADHFQRGRGGFSRVFHRTKINFLRAACNSAFWVQFDLRRPWRHNQTTDYAITPT